MEVEAIYCDTRFKHGGKTYCDNITLERLYKCPKCNEHIFESNFINNKTKCPNCKTELKISEG